MRTPIPKTASDVRAAKRGLEGLRLLALESRRSSEMAKLIENYGGVPVTAPSMREVPIHENAAAFEFARDLLAGRFQIVIFLTGVGTRILFSAMETQHAREPLVDALSHTTVVVRGPKPAAALRELGVPIAIQVPEPNTWRDLLKALDEQEPPTSLQGKIVAVQEYGARNPELLDGLGARGARIKSVPVYQWALPEDTEPLRQAVKEICEGRIDVLLVTSAIQVEHLMQVAGEAGMADCVRPGLQRGLIASIGPISTEALQRYGLSADMEPEHPKMGQLVFELAQKARKLLEEKRGKS